MQTSAPAPANAGQTPAPATASSGTPATLGARTIVARDGVTNAEIYRGLQSQREVLRDQRRDLENRREQLVQELRKGQPAESRPGLEKRITEIDQRLSQIEAQLSSVETDVAEAAALPGATAEPPALPRNGPPEEFWALSAFAIFIIGLPLTIAYARRIWRKSAGVHVATLPPELTEKMAALEQGVEAIAVEVERIGEGQRFVTQLLAEGERRGEVSRALPRHEG